MCVHMQLLLLQSWYANNFYSGMHKNGNDILLLNIAKLACVVCSHILTMYVHMYV